MRIWKRASAFLCAALLILNLALYPLRARATAGALAAVAGVTVLGAYLMASGVYPYISEAGQSLSEWTSDNLQPLIDKYNNYLIGIGKSYQIVLNGATPTIKGYLTQGVICVANDTWNKLREFVQWIQSEYALVDDQTAVRIGVVSASYVEITPSILNFPSNAASDVYDTLVRDGYYLGEMIPTNTVSGSVYVAGKLFHDAKPFYLYPWGTGEGVVFSIFSHHPFNWRQTRLYRGSKDWWGRDVTTTTSYTLDGVTYSIYGDYSDIVTSVRLSTLNDKLSGITIYPDRETALRAFLGLIPSSGNFSGIVADTTIVTPLQTLPADTPWGGLAVQGTSNPAGAVEQGIMEREKPVVRPVEVEIQQGTDVDSETGEVTENPVVVSPEDVIPTVAALSPPASFISALQTTMTTKFPFCLPFDLFKILRAFYVAPEAPVFSLSFHDPFSNSDFSIRVDLSPWDEVAAVVRNFEAMILLAGFCLNFDKFNVIHLILGGLG